jgi:hypothetical protein
LPAQKAGRDIVCNISSACLDRAENLLRCGQVPGLFLRKHQFPVGKYVQHPAPTQAQLYFLHSGLGFQFALQAPGLTANVGSKETTLDFDFHGPTFTIWMRETDIVVE